MIYPFDCKAEGINRIVFPFLTKSNISDEGCRLHFQKLGSFANSFPLLFGKDNILAFCSFHIPAFLYVYINIGVLGAQCQQLKRYWHLPRKKIK